MLAGILVIFGINRQFAFLEGVVGVFRDLARAQGWYAHRRTVQVGLLSGSAGEIDLLKLVLRRLQVKGSSMRPRSLADKRAIARKFAKRWLPLLVAGRLRPVIDSVFPLERVAEAHARLASDLSFGKILLTLD